jgi:hypothetical protein
VRVFFGIYNPNEGETVGELLISFNFRVLENYRVGVMTK